MSLRTRLTVWYGALLALTLVAFSVFLYVTLERSLSSGVDEALSLRADQIRRALGPSMGALLEPEDIVPGDVDRPLEEFAAPGIYVQVLNNQGAVVSAPSGLFGGELPVPAVSLDAMRLNSPRLADTRVSGSGVDADVRVLTVPLTGSNGEVVGAVQVGQSLAPLEGTMAAVSRLLLLAGGTALLLAVAVGWLLTHTALRPVARMTETARLIAETGDYSQRLHVGQGETSRGDELSFLAATFNAMIARLEQVLTSQHRLLADTSHELRNPLTVIRGNLAVLRRQNLAESTRREALQEAEEEAARMGRLVNDLLLLARVDAAEAVDAAFVRVNFSDLVTATVEKSRSVSSGAPVSLSVEPDVYVMGDADRLKQLVGNLVENALRYTPSNEQIRVSLATDLGPEVQQVQGLVRSRQRTGEHGYKAGSPMAVLTVRDTGIGIAADQLPHVFERFYRADKARSRAVGGTGLGLAIARYVAQAHRGSIEATSEGVNLGSIFTVRLPLTSAPVEASQTSREAGRDRSYSGQPILAAAGSGEEPT